MLLQIWVESGEATLHYTMSPIAISLMILVILISWNHVFSTLHILIGGALYICTELGRALCSINHHWNIGLNTASAVKLHCHTYRIAGNFRGRKLSRISRFFRHLRKFSPRNSRHATPIMWPVLTFHESFLHKILLSYRSAKVFSFENFPLYGKSLVRVIYMVRVPCDY